MWRAAGGDGSRMPVAAGGAVGLPVARNVPYRTASALGEGRLCRRSPLNRTKKVGLSVPKSSVVSLPKRDLSVTVIKRRKKPAFALGSGSAPNQEKIIV